MFASSKTKTHSSQKEGSAQGPVMSVHRATAAQLGSGFLGAGRLPRIHRSWLFQGSVLCHLSAMSALHTCALASAAVMTAAVSEQRTGEGRGTQSNCIPVSGSRA